MCSSDLGSGLGSSRLLLSSRLGDGGLFLCQYNLNVARVGHVRIDTTVSTVCSATTLTSSVDLNVCDAEFLDIETLRLGVGLSVLEEIDENVDALLWPATLGGALGSVNLSGTTNSTVEATERDGLTVTKNVTEEALSLSQGEVLDGLSSLTGVLEVNTEI